MTDKKKKKSGKEVIVKPEGNKFIITKTNGKKITRYGMDEGMIKHHRSIGNKVVEA